MELERKFQEKLIGIRRDCTVAVAVSGGVDSMVLMHLMSLVETHNPIILTVNHGFREEAVNEVNFVKQQAEMLNLQCHILSNQGCSIRNKSQEEARNIRYSLIERWCAEHSVEFVVTAHTKSDQAETVLMRLERGSGVDGLSGMRSKSAHGKVIIFRPMLEFSRVEVLEYAAHKKLAWIDDPSNVNPKYKRTFYRSFISENQNPSLVTDRIYRTSQHMQRALSCILHYVKSSLSTCVQYGDLGYVRIKYDEFRKLHEEIASRILLLLLMAVGNRNTKPRYEKFSAVFNKIWGRTTYKPFTTYGCKIIRDDENGDVLIIREVADIQRVTPVEKVPSTVEWDGRFVVSIKDMGQCLGHNKELTKECGALDSLNAGARGDTMHLTPLGCNKIPEDFAPFRRDIVCGLPALVVGDKILASALQNYNMGTTSVVYIEKVLVKDMVDSLIFNQLGQ
ncbi:tRNA lysidine(34) synthetase TilS [Anaplasma bovis]|uniref:tRNA lysidine(34) synthetase TilS n=1 Tax=Anaplasma bovis TaxID=186733 RepID=UPI002FF3BE42